MVAFNYLPVFTGRIPFPTDLVLRHAAYNQITGAAAPKPSPEIGDLITSFYPYHALTSRIWKGGALPLWNPFILGGSPLQASSQSAPFYPLNFLYDLLPMNVAWTVCILFRLFLAALFMTLLVRSMGGSSAGSIVSGIIFSLCGFMTAWQGQGMGDAAIWLPLICYAVHRLHRTLSTPSIALAAIAFAMPVLAGHPETAFHLTLTGCAFALVLACTRFEARFIAGFAVAGVLALALASIQIVPTLEWFGQVGSSLNTEPPILSRHDGQGFFSRDLVSSPNSALIPIPEAASYLGMFGLMAVPMALFHRSRRNAAFFAALAVAAAAIAFSVEPAHWIAAHIPLLKQLKNGRLILVASFGIAVLAGLGISVLDEDMEAIPSRKKPLALALLSGTFLFALAGIYEVHRATLVPVAFMRGPWASLAFLTVAAGFLTWRLLSGSRGRSFSILICVFTGLELLTFSFGYTGFARPSEIFPSAPVFNFLQSRGGAATFRMAKAGYPIPANSGIIYGIETADGYEIASERARTFNNGLMEQRDDAVFYEAEKVTQTQDRRTDMLNVRYWVVIAGSPEFQQFQNRADRYVQVFNSGSMVVFESKSVLPRLFAVPQSGIQVIPDTTAQMAQILNPFFNPEQTTLFSEKPEGAGSAGSLNGLNEGSPKSTIFTSDIQLTQGDDNSYTFHTRVSSRSVLVLSQIFYPGWKATIDGAQVPVYPVDYALTGILAPEGEHTIAFFFQPRSFKVGAVLSMIGLCFTLMLLKPMAVLRKARTL